MTVNDFNSVKDKTKGVLTATVNDDAANLVQGTTLKLDTNDVLTITVKDDKVFGDTGNPTVAELKTVLDKGTASKVTLTAKVKGSYAELKDLNLDKATDTITIELTDAQSGSAGVTAINKIASFTKKADGITAEVSASASELKSLNMGVATNSALKVTATGVYEDTTTAEVADLKALVAKTKGVVTASVKGTKSEVTTTTLDGVATNDVIAIEIEDKFLGTAADDADLKQLKALRGLTSTGKITAKVDATLAKLTDGTFGLNTKATDDITLAVTDTKIEDANRGKLEGLVALTAKPVTATAEFSKTELESFITNANLDGNDLIAVTHKGATTISAAQYNTLKTKTAGVVTAKVHDTAAALAQGDSLSLDKTDVLTITVSDSKVFGANGSPTLAEFKTLTDKGTDSNLTITASIKGTADDIKALNIDAATDTMTIEVTDTQSGSTGVTNLNAVALLTGKANGITATLEASADELKSLSLGDRKASAVAVKATGTYDTDGTDKVSHLESLLGATAGVVTASVQGSHSQLASNNLANLKSTDKVDIKFEESIDGAANNDVDLIQLKALRDKTGGKITATVQGSIAKLSNGTYGLNTKSTDSITLTVGTTAGDKLETEFNALSSKTDKQITATISATKAQAKTLTLANFDGDDLTVEITDALDASVGADVTLLNELAQYSSNVITASISGNSSQLAGLNATHLDGTDAITISSSTAYEGSSGVTALNTLAGLTKGVTTATASGTVAELKNLSTDTNDQITLTASGDVAVADVTTLSSKSGIAFADYKLVDSVANVNSGSIDSLVSNAKNVVITEARTTDNVALKLGAANTLSKTTH